MDETIKSFDFDTFQKATNQMIATNDNAYKGRYDRMVRSKLRDYTPEEIERIINSGALSEQQKLSRNYFHKDGFYSQIIMHYATLLKYTGLLIPNPSFGKSLSTPHIQKKYYSALDYVEKLNLKSALENWAIRALTDGCYYGVITQMNKDCFAYMDLPCGYCVSNYKDEFGNDLIEFDVSYFNSLHVPEDKERALKAYPSCITSYYRQWLKGKKITKWMMIPSDIGICFPMFDGRPIFLNVIPATIEYDNAVETEQERNREEIRKVIVQQIPHVADGRLLFEPDEAAEIHKGTVQMMKGNKNLSVLTTYADVNDISSKTAAETQNSTLDRMLNNVYAHAGVSGQIFASTGSSTLDSSLKNDLALMMHLANRFSVFVTNAVNKYYSNSNVTFKYQILPISYYNEKEYIENAFKLASSGYSFLLPALAMDLSQKDLGNIKDLENDVLGLGEKLRPLASAYTQSGADEEGGRPSKEQEEKADKTIQNEKSLDNQTEGGNN